MVGHELRSLYTRSVLADCLGLAPRCVPLGRAPTGKPIIEGVDQPLAFSLAHCETHAVVAIARNALVGVDVEQRRTEIDALGIARRYFAREEADMLTAQRGEALDAGFLRLWVCKEAFAKAIGLGLSYPLDRVIVRGFHGADPQYSFIEAAYGPISQWSLRTFECERNCYMAVAVRSLREGCAPTVARIMRSDPFFGRSLHDRTLQPSTAQ